MSLNACCCGCLVLPALPLIVHPWPLSEEPTFVIVQNAASRGDKHPLVSCACSQAITCRIDVGEHTFCHRQRILDDRSGCPAMPISVVSLCLSCQESPVCNIWLPHAEETHILPKNHAYSHEVRKQQLTSFLGFKKFKFHVHSVRLQFSRLHGGDASC